MLQHLVDSEVGKGKGSGKGLLESSFDFFMDTSVYSSLASEDATETASYDDDPELLAFKDFVRLHAGGCGMPSSSSL